MNWTQDKKRVVIVGGGIAGLSAAFRLRELSREQNIPVDIKVLEADSRFGGMIRTEYQKGCLLEAGPDSFISDKPWALDLCRRLGLENEIISTNLEKRRSFILKKNRLHSVPEGFYLTVPRNLRVLAKTSLLSFWGKLRMAMDLFLPVRSDKEDESVGHFIERRLGKEALTWLGQPMIGGIYSADPYRLSVRAATPHLYELEQKHGSLIRGLKNKADLKDSEKASGPRYGLFLSLREGISSMVKALVNQLPEEDLIASSPVQYVELRDGWNVYTGSGEVFRADAVCLAVPAYHASEMLRAVSIDLSDHLQSISYESVATVNLIYDRKDIGHALDGFGFVVPEAEKKNMIGCSFSSIKYPDRSDSEEKVLLRAFAGGAFRRGFTTLKDEVLEAVITEELAEILKIKQKPIHVSIARYLDAMPQYHVGHLDRMRLIEEKAAEFPGLFLLGNAYSGVGIPDVIHRSEDAAAEIIGMFSSATSAAEQV